MYSFCCGKSVGCMLSLPPTIRCGPYDYPRPVRQSPFNHPYPIRQSPYYYPPIVLGGAFNHPPIVCFCIIIFIYNLYLSKSYIYLKVI